MDVRPNWSKETQFLPSSDLVDTAIWMHHMDAKKTAWEKSWRQLHKIAVSTIEEVLETTPHKTAAIRLTTTHHKNYQN